MTDVRGGYQAMLVVSRTRGATREVLVGQENVWLFNSTDASSPQYESMNYVDGTKSQADARAEFDARIAATGVPLNEIHFPTPMYKNSRGAWTLRPVVRSGRYGFPKGSQKTTDNNKLSTAIREFQEEVGVQIPPSLPKSHGKTSGVYVFVADITNVPSLMSSLAGPFPDDIKSELFDIQWVPRPVAGLPLNAVSYSVATHLGGRRKTPRHNRRLVTRRKKPKFEHLL